jgi:hypothetical protein
MAYYALGRTADSDAALNSLMDSWGTDAAYNIAYVLAFRGDADGAFEWLEKALEYNDPGLSEIAVENTFAPIHNDPRWLSFLRSIGRSPQQLAQIGFQVTLPK